MICLALQTSLLCLYLIAALPCCLSHWLLAESVSKTKAVLQSRKVEL